MMDGMRPLWLAVLLIAAPAAARTEPLYSEPAAGPRLTIDNLKARRRLLGTDWYCIRDVSIDGVKVFGGNHCRIKHGEKKTLRLSPGRHELVFDTISEFGADYEPDVPPIVLSTAVVAGDRDLAVLLRDADPPDVVALDEADVALIGAPAASTSTAAAPAVSTVPLPAPAPAPAASTAPAKEDPFKSLERLKELYDKGVITGDEFKAKKAELLKSIR